jgi:hypothetical protein
MTRSRRALLLLVVCGLFGAPGRAFAQSDKTEVDITPLYLWAARISGHVAVDNQNVPIYVDFKDAAKKLAGAFAVHTEVRRGRWGVLTDVNFLRLSTDVNLTTPITAQPVSGTAKLDSLIFEAGVSYRVKPDLPFNVIGGFRTYTASPNLHFTAPMAPITAGVDVSRTAASVIGGFTYRPKLSPKWTLLSRADIGGGSAFTWSALLGAVYQPNPRLGLMFGYKALGIDTGDVPRSGPVVRDLEFAITQYGPILSLTFHWNQK